MTLSPQCPPGSGREGPPRSCRRRQCRWCCHPRRSPPPLKERANVFSSLLIALTSQSLGSRQTDLFYSVLCIH